MDGMEEAAFPSVDSFVGLSSSNSYWRSIVFSASTQKAKSLSSELFPVVRHADGVIYRPQAAFAATRRQGSLTVEFTNKRCSAEFM